MASRPHVLENLRNAFHWLLGLAASLLLLASAFGYAQSLPYELDNVSQLRLVFLLVQLPLAIVCVLLRYKVAALLAVFGLVANLVDVVPMYGCGRIESQNSVSDLSIVTFNIWGDKNVNYEQVLSYLHQNDPDIICLNEISTKWMTHLNSGLAPYKYRLEQGTSGGSAIFSKVPLCHLKRPPNVRWYGVRATIDSGAQPITLIAEHPPAPFTREKWVRRNEVFEQLTQDANSISAPLIVIGDLNSGPWSPFMKKLLRDSQLHDTECGIGPQPSWSTTMPLVLIPLDHCLISRQVFCKRRRVGPYLGSDHLPVYVELAIQD